jgi:hypothetical protein
MCKVETEVRVRREIAVRVSLRWRFDLDNARAQVRKQRRRVRTGDKGRALNHGDMVENLYRHDNLSALMFHESLGRANFRARVIAITYCLASRRSTVQREISMQGFKPPFGKACPELSLVEGRGRGDLGRNGAGIMGEFPGQDTSETVNVFLNRVSQ